MQIKRTFEGNYAENETGTREYSYGLTKTSSCSISRVDFINQTIANFLHDDCGVDAAYEIRPGNDYKWLWIMDVPFFMTISSNYGYFGACGLKTDKTLFSANNSVNGISNSVFFTNASTGDYKFTLLFTGDPKKCFVLRWIGGNSAGISTNCTLRFLKGTNILNGRTATIWIPYNNFYGNTSAGNSNYKCSYMGAIEFDDSGNPDLTHYTTSNLTAHNYDWYIPILNSNPDNKTTNNSKFPLVPITFGVYKQESAFCRPIGFDLPASTGSATEMQTEVEIDGRKFIVTNDDVLTSSPYHINLGLIEVFD